MHGGIVSGMHGRFSVAEPTLYGGPVDNDRNNKEDDMKWFRYGWMGVVLKCNVSLMTFDSDERPAPLDHPDGKLEWSDSKDGAMVRLKTFHNVVKVDCTSAGCPVCADD